MSKKYVATNKGSATVGANFNGTATAFTVGTGEGVRLPAPTGGDYTLLVLQNTAGVREIICVVGRTGDVCTVGIPGSAAANVAGRNYEAIYGMAAASWVIGDVVSCRPTAELIEAGVNFGASIAAATDKATPVADDTFGLSDSAATNASKKVTWANIKATLLAAFGAATSKATPVNADSLPLYDSAATTTQSRLTWANLKATLVATAHTWTAIQTISAAGTPLVVSSTNSTIDKISLKDNGAQTGRLSSSASYPLLVGNAAGTAWSFYADQSGNVTAMANITAYSDERLKRNWAGLPADFIERLAKVKHGTYDRIDIEQRQIGVSAQSLQVLMPEAVMTDEADMLMVAYGNAALTACIALAEEVVSLRARLDALERA